jgi:hypothetical protein
MISIGIDVSNIDYDNLTGIGNYAKYLTLALTQLDQTKVIGSYPINMTFFTALIIKYQKLQNPKK